MRDSLRGGVRPAQYSKDLRMAVEWKNYNLECRVARRELIDGIVRQARLRARHLPPGTHQGVLIEKKGMTIGDDELEALRRAIAKKSRGLIALDDIGFLGER